MCETMQSSHRLRPAMSLVRALLTPTASGDGAGKLFCAPLPPSPHFYGACPEKSSLFPEKTGKFEDYKLPYIRFLSCHLFGP